MQVEMLELLETLIYIFKILVILNINGLLIFLKLLIVYNILIHKHITRRIRSGALNFNVSDLIYHRMSH